MVKLSTRQNFADLIESRNYKIAVEVGVRYGWFSKYLLDNTSLVKLYAIDPWDINEENDDPFGSYNVAKTNLECYNNRIELIKERSNDVLWKFDSESLDFVYLDALHDYESVSNDIKNWWIRLRKGGCLAGHDYCQQEWSGLVAAVTEFVEQNKLELFLTGIGDGYGEGDYGKKSWYVFRK